MQIARIGFTPVKGGRHLEHDQVDLTIDGPAGDRMFALVDRTRGQVLRTVENPALLTTSAHWSDGELSVEIAGRTATAIVHETGEQLDCEYWGRRATVEVLDGPWAEAYSALLGQHVALTRSIGHGQVVYGSAITIITTSALGQLSAIVGYPIDVRRFRSTFVIDTSHRDGGLDTPIVDPVLCTPGVDSAGLDRLVEDDWCGQQLALGAARVRVLGGVDRCAVIDFDAVSGVTETHLLKALAGYRSRPGGIEFGVFAEVVEAAVVRRGDLVELIPA